MGREMSAPEETSACTDSFGALPSSGRSRECWRLNERKTPGRTQVSEDSPFCTGCSAGCQRSVSGDDWARAVQTNSSAQRSRAGKAAGLRRSVWYLFNPTPAQAVRSEEHTSEL